MIERKQLLTSVGYHWRYMDGTDRARQLLKGRTLGMALGYWMGGMPGVYWWRRMEGSGGQFVEQTTHIVDLLRYVGGEVEEVYAVYGSRLMARQEADVTVPDVGTVTLRLASGAAATISNTCMLPVDHMTGLHLYTDAGVLELSHGGLRDVQFEQVTEYRSRGNPYEAQTRGFLHALRTGDAAGIRSTYSDAYRTQQVTAAANMSAASGAPVNL